MQLGGLLTVAPALLEVPVLSSLLPVTVTTVQSVVYHSVVLMSFS